MRLKALISGLIVASVSSAFADPKSGEEYPAQSLNWDLPLEAIPDLRIPQEDVVMPAKRTLNYFVVPRPMSRPTFGTGRILGGAYYNPQTAEEKASHPASFTGAAAG